MRDLPRCCEILFDIDSYEAADRVTALLDALRKDRRRSIHEKVASDMDYEELYAALLCAKRRIAELEWELHRLHSEVETA